MHIMKEKYLNKQLIMTKSLIMNFNLINEYHYLIFLDLIFFFISVNFNIFFICVGFLSNDIRISNTFHAFSWVHLMCQVKLTRKELLVTGWTLDDWMKSRPSPRPNQEWRFLHKNRPFSWLGGGVPGSATPIGKFYQFEI